MKPKHVAKDPLICIINLVVMTVSCFHFNNIMNPCELSLQFLSRTNNVLILYFSRVMCTYTGPSGRAVKA
jgi:hypothetical protein